MRVGDYSKGYPADKAAAQERGVREVLDLCGVPCPLSWAKAKTHLERLPRGTELQIVLDDPKGARDLPHAAEASGYALVEVRAVGSAWCIVIQR